MTSPIGLSTYAYFWQHNELAPERLDLAGMIDRTAEAGVSLFQICDYPQVEQLDESGLAAIRARADDLGVTLELGTKGVSVQHLARYRALAVALGATVVRSMVYSPTERPTLAQAQFSIETELGAWEAEGLTLALETYEQVSSTDLVSLVEAVGRDSFGICLDPANTVAALENPRDVIDRTAPYVKNIHVKDFRFTRRGGWVGFTLEGAPLGTGLLGYDHLIATVRPAERGISRVIEHWLPLGDSIEETIEEENTWNTHNLQYLRSKS